jgi:hypothetical protein
MRWILEHARLLAVLLGLVGGLASGWLGYVWRGEYVAAEEEETVNEKYPSAKVSYFLMAALPLGIAGGVFVLLGRTWSAAALLLLAFLGPTVLYLHWLSVLLTLPLLAAGVLCIWISLRPRGAGAMA